MNVPTIADKLRAQIAVPPPPPPPGPVGRRGGRPQADPIQAAIAKAVAPPAVPGPGGTPRIKM